MDASAGTSKAVSSINITPLIDVLLVLLIIFMVIVPVVPHGLDALISQPAKAETPAPENTIVVQVLADGNGEPTYKINQTTFPKSQIRSQLASIFAARRDRTMFVKGDGRLEFSKVAEVVNMGSEAGVDHIALITPKIEAGQ